MDRGERMAELLPDPCGFAGCERPMHLQQLLERAAVDELHPDADPVVVLLGAVDNDDVGMTETGEEPRFLEDARGLARRRLALVQELERDLAMKPVSKAR